MKTPSNEDLPAVDIKKELKQRTVRKHGVSFISDKKEVGLSGIVLYPKIYQLDNDQVVFNLKEPVYFYIKKMIFDGPNYHEETYTQEEGQTKKKRHGLDGTLIGGAFGPAGAIAGGIAGHGMGKDKTTNNSVSQTVTVEDPSVLTMTLENVATSEVISVRFSAMNSDYQELFSFKVRIQEVKTPKRNAVQPEQPKKQTSSALTDDAVDQLKRLKGLLDAEVITQDDFDVKKKQILGI